MVAVVHVVHLLLYLHIHIYFLPYNNVCWYLVSSVSLRCSLLFHCGSRCLFLSFSPLPRIMTYFWVARNELIVIVFKSRRSTTFFKQLIWINMFLKRVWTCQHEYFLPRFVIEKVFDHCPYATKDKSTRIKQRRMKSFWVIVREDICHGFEQWFIKIFTH